MFGVEILMFTAPKKYRGLKRYINKFPGLDTLNGNRKFYSWWYLKDDSAWTEIYDQTGLLNGKKPKAYRLTLNRVLTNLFKTQAKPIIHFRDKRSYTRGTFYWNEGLSYMKKGGKATLIIPSNLAYGSNGTDKIPGYSTLIFDLELISII